MTVYNAGFYDRLSGHILFQLKRHLENLKNRIVGKKFSMELDFLRTYNIGGQLTFYYEFHKGFF